MLVEATGNPISPYFLAVTVFAIAIILMAVFLPESLSERRQKRNRREAEDERTRRREKKRHGSVSRRALSSVKGAFSFLSPLRLLLPRSMSDGAPEGVHILPRFTGNGRSWALPLVALSYAGLWFAATSQSARLMYAQYMFGWGPAMLGFAMTLSGSLKAFWLLFGLPLSIRLLRDRPAVPKEALPASEASAFPGLQRDLDEQEMQELKRQEVLRDARVSLLACFRGMKLKSRQTLTLNWEPLRLHLISSAASLASSPFLILQLMSEL